MAGVGLAGPLQQRLPGLEERLCRLCHLRNDEDSADAFLMQASATLETLKQLSEDGGENSTFSNLVQLYAQPLSVLGVELLECLYWRRGALLYMFCHTVKGRKEWLMEKMETFKKFLSEGVNYLVKMLGFRCSVDLNEEFVSQDADTARLLHEGIFSDTHLLAMMYSGEMCYWGLNYFGKGKPPLQSTDSGSNSEQHCSARTEIVDFRDMGEKMLKKYIDVCEGPLREHEWNTRNAKLILDYFRQLST
ncbi:RAB7A-interacting MON1-CCZ1 complex subunit 1 isoform X2 [Eublepharis macularius]|uniref:RAB7A-interacting MON1-CCZ1 complex subunit 1 isoform X2 n=1 Tax=Eublepharis macularius TaxID=481883 RepID=A0AA97JU09_EUBMA|nr:RAB7A-interacting MON1-CCZ1 complex subunit 1 isoform X2 [Eublepharis macularius]